MERRAAQREYAVARATESYAAGALDDALMRVRGIRSVSAYALEMRILLRRDAPADAQAAVALGKEHLAMLAASTDIAQNVDFLFAHAQAYLQVGRLDAMQGTLTQARESMRHLSDAAFWANLLLHEAQLARAQGELWRVDDLIRQALTFEDRGVSAHAYLLLARLAVAQQRLHDAIGAYEEAWPLLLASPLFDAFTAAGVLHEELDIALELDAQPIIDAIAERARAMPWTDALRDRELALGVSLAWVDAMRGEELRALRLLRDAQSATVPIVRVRAAIRRAELAQRLFSPQVAGDDIALARDAARAFDWHAASPADRRLLLDLVAVVAPVALEDARDLFTRFEVATENDFLVDVDDEQNAAIGVASAALAIAAGQPDQARARLESAYAYYMKHERLPRAARVAAYLVDLGAGEPYATTLRTIRERYAGRVY
jgi:tetratricopeptide (TPR) repeat protein